MNKDGKVWEVEKPIVEGKIIHNFICARVLLNVNKPSPAGCWIPNSLDLIYQKSSTGMKDVKICTLTMTSLAMIKSCVIKDRDMAPTPKTQNTAMVLVKLFKTPLRSPRILYLGFISPM